MTRVSDQNWRSLPAALAHAGLGCLLAAALTSCAHRPIPLPPPSASAWGSGRPAVQYRPTWVAGGGFPTVEVYLRNDSREAVAYDRALLDGRQAWSVATVPADQPVDQPAEGVVWAQFYPDAIVPPGGMAVFQICLRDFPAAERQLEFHCAGGAPLAVALPPFRPPGRFVSAATFSGDGRRVFVQVREPDGGAEIARVFLNGWEYRQFLSLPAAAGGPAARAVALDLPSPMAAGQPLHVAVEFADGRTCHALLRCMKGISLDAYNPSKNVPPMELHLDAEPPAAMLEAGQHGDVACADTAKGVDGFFAPEAARLRREKFRSLPAQLSSIHYCTGYYTSMWSIYGALPDAVYVSPYRLAHGGDKTRFIEDELDLVGRARDSIRPRPLFYIPETYRTEGRFPEPEELRLLCWSAIVGGAKGLKYFVYDYFHTSMEGMAKSPGLLDAAIGIGTAVRAREDLLSTLMPVSRERLAQPPDIEMQVAWAGDAGILLLVRNLRYRTSGGTPDGMPAFVGERRRDLTLRVGLPPWLEARKACDFLSGAPLRTRPVRAESGDTREVDIVLDRLDAFRLVWIGDRRTPRLGGLRRQPTPRPEAAGLARPRQAAECPAAIAPSIRRANLPAASASHPSPRGERGTC